MIKSTIEQINATEIVSNLTSEQLEQAKQASRQAAKSKQASKQADKQTSKQADKQASKRKAKSEKQADKQASKQTSNADKCTSVQEYADYFNDIASDKITAIVNEKAVDCIKFFNSDTKVTEKTPCLFSLYIKDIKHNTKKLKFLTNKHTFTELQKAFEKNEKVTISQDKKQITYTTLYTDNDNTVIDTYKFLISLFIK